MTIKHKSSDNQTKSSPKSKQETPIRSIFCLKKITDIDKIDKLEDCFILDFDPTEPVDGSKSKVIDGDLSVVTEKGQVAGRDYAHASAIAMSVIQRLLAQNGRSIAVLPMDVKLGRRFVHKEGRQENRGIRLRLFLSVANSVHQGMIRAIYMEESYSKGVLLMTGSSL
ncbi:hypothetical protein AKJ16_DCAP08580 [Drosera capensis]